MFTECGVLNLEVSEVLQDDKTRPSLVEDVDSTMGYF